MDVKTWAKKEIELVIADEKTDNAEFVIGCCEAALHAFETMVDDVNLNKKGALGVNAQILNQLINHQPLTPIDDISENWEKISEDNLGVLYSCTRLESLSKLIKSNGKIFYTDSARYYCVDIHNPKSPFTGGLAGRILDEMIPIEFPYMPVGKIRIFLEQFSTQPITPPHNNEPDLLGILYFRFPDGRMQSINKFFKRNKETNELDEIDLIKYGSLKKEYEKGVK